MFVDESWHEMKLHLTIMRRREGRAQRAEGRGKRRERRGGIQALVHACDRME